MNTVEWANAAVDAGSAPKLVTETPGPASRALHERMTRRTGTALTSMVRLHPVAWERGEGVVLHDVDGNAYLDFSSGIVVTNLGHAHPAVARAVADAAARLDNVHDFAHPDKVEAIEALCAVLPPALGTVAFFSSGTEAVECAVRVARAVTGRPAMAGVWGDYHGRTGGSASVSGLRSANAARDPGTLLVPSGHARACMVCDDACTLACVELADRSMAHHGADQLAGLVVEPVTNASGAVVYAPGYLAALADAVRRRGGLFVADEVACGMGRAGAWSAAVDDGVVPDVLVLGKGLGNGFPLSAVVVADEHADALGAAYPSTTYGGNPMAMAALRAVVATIVEEGLLDHVRRLGDHALDRLGQTAARFPGTVVDARGRGALLAVELADAALGDAVVRACYRRGLALVTSGAVVRITPPIVLSTASFDVGAAILDDALAEVSSAA